MSHQGQIPISTPILAVQDVQAAVTFYERLGFTVDRFNPKYAIVSVEGHEVFHLEVSDIVEASLNPGAAYLNVSNADELRAKWLQAGAPVGDIANRPWGMREFTVDDPSGNTLRVGTNL